MVKTLTLLLILVTWPAVGQPSNYTTINAPAPIMWTADRPIGWIVSVSPVYIPAFGACFPITSSFCQKVMDDQRKNDETTLPLSEGSCFGGRLLEIQADEHNYRAACVTRKGGPEVR